jgi:cysteine desulfurase
MRVYLDHNATSPLLPQARAAMLAALDAGGNPSSVHGEGRVARRMVELARADVAQMVNAKSAEVVFTSGGSEANALGLRGAVRAAEVAGNPVTHLFVGATEHDAVLSIADDLRAERPALIVRRLDVDAQGVIDLLALDAALAAADGRALVSVMLANNETGVMAPLAEIVRIAKTHGALVHTDAAQAAGRIDVDFAVLGVDLMTLSAHKMGGPQGAGALVVRDGVVIARQIAGGGQELGRRAGTENVAAIAGFGAAAANRQDWAATENLRDRLEAGVLAAVPQAVIYGAGAPRIPNTSLIGLPSISGETQVMAMDLAGVSVSSGAACSSGKVKTSHVLAAMGAGAEAGDAIRVSLGPATTSADIETFLAAWTAFVSRVSSRRAVGLAA